MKRASERSDEMGLHFWRLYLSELAIYSPFYLLYDLNASFDPI